jgi:hypothetical protein
MNLKTKYPVIWEKLRLIPTLYYCIYNSNSDYFNSSCKETLLFLKNFKIPTSFCCSGDLRNANVSFVFNNYKGLKEALEKTIAQFNSEPLIFELDPNSNKIIVTLERDSFFNSSVMLLDFFTITSRLIAKNFPKHKKEFFDKKELLKIVEHEVGAKLPYDCLIYRKMVNSFDEVIRVASSPENVEIINCCYGMVNLSLAIEIGSDFFRRNEFGQASSFKLSPTKEFVEFFLS